MTLSVVQTAVSQTAVIGVPGDAYDAEPCTLVTKIASEVIPFGVWVSFNVEDKADLADSTGEVTGLYRGGVAMRDPNLPSGSTGYQIGDPVTVMTRGKVFVLAEQTVVIADSPFTRFATGTGTQLGAFRNDADTATCVAAPNTRFFKGGGTTSPPVLEIY